MTKSQVELNSDQVFPKISVGVPVYNTLKYLKKSLESLLSQTLMDIEFILVDDGSTDGSGEICDQYALKDFRFKVIHQSNAGLAGARQTGLDSSHGEYVIVCDSDDWVEPTMYEKMIRKAEETGADMVLCGYFAEYDEKLSVQKQTIFKEIDGFVDNFDLVMRGANSSWVKLIRKSLFTATGAKYEPGINLSEDSLIHYKLMKGNPKVVQIRDNLYHYRRQFGGQSYTNNVRMEHIRQLEFTYRWFKANYTAPEYTPLIRKRALDLVFACMRVNHLDKAYLSNFLRSELPWRELCICDNSLKKLIASMLKTLPIALVKKAVNLIYPFIYK